MRLALITVFLVGCTVDTEAERAIRDRYTCVETRMVPEYRRPVIAWEDNNPVFGEPEYVGEKEVCINKFGRVVVF